MNTTKCGVINRSDEIILATSNDAVSLEDVSGFCDQSVGKSGTSNVVNQSWMSKSHFSNISKQRSKMKIDKLIELFNHIPVFEAKKVPQQEMQWDFIIAEVKKTSYLKKLFFDLFPSKPRNSSNTTLLKQYANFQNHLVYRQELGEILGRLGASPHVVAIYKFGKNVEVSEANDVEIYVAEEILSPNASVQGADLSPVQANNIETDSIHNSQVAVIPDALCDSVVPTGKRNIRKPDRFSPSLIRPKKTRLTKAVETSADHILGCCNVLYSESRNVVGCDRCCRWFHFTCAEYDIEFPEDASFYCKECFPNVNELTSTLPQPQHHANTMHVDNTPPGHNISNKVSAVSDNSVRLSPTKKPNQGLPRPTRLASVDLQVNDSAQNEDHSSPDITIPDISSDQEDEDMNDDDVAAIIGLSDKNKSYKAPREFEFEMPWEIVKEMVDWNLGKFKPHSWASDFDMAFKMVHVCGFNALRSPYYYKGKNGKPPLAFAKIVGSCHCTVTFVVFAVDAPQKNHPMVFRGKGSDNFKLVQVVNTGTRITGRQRQIMAEKLQHQKPSKVQCIDTNELDARRICHNNHTARSLQVLQKIKSEHNLRKRLDKNLLTELQMLTTHLQDEDQKLQSVLFRNKTAKMTGYIWDLKVNPFQVYMFCREQLQGTALLLAEAPQEEIRFYTDSTGGVSKKPRGQHSNVLLTTVIIKVGALKPFVVAEMLSCQNAGRDFSTFLERVFADMRQFKNVRNPPLFVCDFSFALIHGILRGVNCLKLGTYLDLCYKVFVGELKQFPSDITCLFLCTAHIMKAFLGNLCRKTRNKKIRKLAMFSFARLVEVKTEEDYTTVLHGIFSLFGSQYLPHEEYMTMLVGMMKNVDPVAATLCVEDDVEFELTFTSEEVMKHQTQRERSSFYQHFVSQQEIHCELDCENLFKNPNYEPAVIEVLKKDYIAYLPLWSRCVITKRAGLESFVRETSGAVEGLFKDYKSNLHGNLPVSAADFIRAQYKIVIGIAKDRIMNAFKTGIIKRKPKQFPTTEELPSEPCDENNATENWKYKNPALHRVASKYLSKKEPKQPPTLKNTRVERKTKPVTILLESDSDDDFDMSKSNRRNSRSHTQGTNKPPADVAVSNKLRITIDMEEPIIDGDYWQCVYFNDIYDYVHGMKWMDCQIANHLIKVFKTKYVTNETECVLLNYDACFFRGSIVDPQYYQWEFTPTALTNITPATKVVYHVWFLQDHYMLLKIEIKIQENIVTLSSTLFNPLKTCGSAYDLCVMQGRPMLKNRIKDHLLTFPEISALNPEFEYIQENGDCPPQNDSENCSTACFRLLQFELGLQTQDDFISLWAEDLCEYRNDLLEMLLRSSPVGLSILEAYDNDVMLVVEYFYLAHQALVLATAQHPKAVPK